MALAHHRADDDDRECQPGGEDAGPVEGARDVAAGLMPGDGMGEGDEGEEGERELGVDRMADGEGCRLEVAISSDVKLVEEHAQAAEQALQDDQADEGVGRQSDVPAGLPEAMGEGDRDAE